MGNAKVTTESAGIDAIILRTASLTTAIGIIIGAVFSVLKIVDDDKSYIEADNIRVYLVFLNFMALIVFCFFSTRVPRIDFAKQSEDSEKKYSELLNANALLSNERVNILVRQLHNNILLYAFFLIIVYLLYLGEKMYVATYPDETNLLFFKVGQDVFNFLSSVFVYLGFKVLYNQTLDDNNKPILYYLDAITFSIIYLIAYALILFNFFPFSAEKHIHALNLLGLVSGIFNGLAMGLLFGRFVSMEHVFMDLKKTGGNHFFVIGALFILPTYAIVQPLFGSFSINAFGDPKVFANFVFLVCLIGKVFFLFLYSHYSKRRFLHLYLHIVITRRGLSSEFVNLFKRYPNKKNE